LHSSESLENAISQGRRVVGEVGGAPADQNAELKAVAPAETRMLPVWVMPQGAATKLKSKAFLVQYQRVGHTGG